MRVDFQAGIPSKLRRRWKVCNYHLALDQDLAAQLQTPAPPQRLHYIVVQYQAAYETWM